MRSPFVLSLLSTCFLAPITVSTSTAGVPSAQQCTVPLVMAACPAGDLPFVVVVRDLASQPINGSNVVIDFSACPDIHFCAMPPSPAYAFGAGATISLYTDALGQAVFYLEAGGTCGGGIKIFADGVLLDDGVVGHPVVEVSNTDQTGDEQVTSADAALMAAETATDPTADLNGDGVHDTADETLLAAHIGHVCPSLATPANHKSWGGLKLIYR